MPTVNLDNVDNNVVKGVFFDSNKIKKNDTKYFTKIQGAEERKRAEEMRQKREKFLRKAKKFLWDGGHKYILIAFLAAIVAITALSLLWTNVWKPQKEERERVEQESQEYLEAMADLGKTREDFFKIYKSNKSNAYLEAIAYIENLIETSEEPNKSRYLSLYGDILVKEFNLYDDAIEQLLRVDLESVRDSSIESDVYANLEYAYLGIGDQVKADEYAAKYREMMMREEIVPNAIEAERDE